jgi:hypothetical protein
VTQTGTNRHKQAQTGTNANRQFFVPAQILRGEAHLPPFQPSRMGAPARPPDGNVRSGGSLATGTCRLRHICPRCLCGPILLPLPRLLLATAPPPLTTSHHRYRLVDCRIVSAANATLSASYSSLLSLQPHVCAHPPSPPADRCLNATFLVSVSPSGDGGGPRPHRCRPHRDKQWRWPVTTEAFLFMMSQYRVTI